MQPRAKSGLVTEGAAKRPSTPVAPTHHPRPNRRCALGLGAHTHTAPRAAARSAHPAEVAPCPNAYRAAAAASTRATQTRRQQTTATSGPKHNQTRHQQANKNQRPKAQANKQHQPAKAQQGSYCYKTRPSGDLDPAAPAHAQGTGPSLPIALRRGVAGRGSIQGPDFIPPMAQLDDYGHAREPA